MTTLDDADAPVAPERRPNVLIRLYRGETSFDFTGRRRWWYALSTVVILAGLVSLGTRGLNLGIDFKGGTSWQVPSNGVSIASATDTVKAAGVNPSLVQVVGVGSSAHVLVEADLKGESVTTRTAVEQKVAQALAQLTHSSVQQAEQNVSDVGPTWGGDITHKAVLAVIVFFIVVVIYISFRFEWKMAIAALVAVLHDLLVVAGIYSLSGLQVTPDTVVAVLTILGYSLYDTVVVFDRVRENTRGNFGVSGRMTYEDVVNLSMNQTLARSINTSLVAILPVLSVLVVGAQLLGATTLQYFGFALVIGLLSGAYSSIFIASPLLAQMKEREPRYATIRQRLASRADREVLTPRAAALASVSAGGAAAARQARSGKAAPRRQGEVLRPGAARGPGQRAGAGAAGAAASGPDDVDDLEGPASGRGAGGPARASGSRAGAGGTGGGTGGGARRPPPRPRKGGGKGRKGGRRR